MNTIFGKPLTKITTEDLKSFCKKEIREGINLDYKKDLNSGKTISKTIASMANTLGGWIIAGVEDDGNDRPLLPAVGMKYEDQIELKISSIIIDNISPPIFPLVHVCKPDKDNKTFVVIYVPESDKAPHWMFNDNKLLIRRADRSSFTSWERLAKSNEWEYLREKRKKAEKIYEDHIDLLNDLFWQYDFQSYLEYSSNKQATLASLTISTPDNDRESKDLLSINISPKYPTKQLFEVEGSEELLRELRFPDTYGTGNYFPFLIDKSRLFSNGVSVYGSSDRRETILFFALNSFGVTSFKEKVVEKSINKRLVSLSRLLVKFKQNLIFSRKLYEKVNYLGVIHVDVFLHVDSWTDLRISDQQSQFDRFQTPLGEIKFVKDLHLSDLSEENINTTVEEFYRVIANSFRWGPSRRIKLSEVFRPFRI